MSQVHSICTCKQGLIQISAEGRSEGRAFNLQEKIFAAHGVMLQSILFLSICGLRNLRRALNNIGKNILPAEQKMVAVKKPLVAQVSKGTLKVE